MKTFLSALVAGATILGSLAPVSAQAQLHRKASACVHPPPYADANEYVAERAALSGGWGTRQSCTLRLRLANGRFVELVDRIEEGDAYRRYVYDRYIPDATLHVVSVHLYEGGAYFVVHFRSGSKTWLPGPPLVSPDRERFVAASSSLDDHYAPNRIEIWRVGPAGLKREFVLTGGHAWSPLDLKWEGGTIVRWTQVRLNSSLREDRRSPASLSRREGRWSVEWAPQ